MRSRIAAAPWSCLAAGVLVCLCLLRSQVEGQVTDLRAIELARWSLVEDLRIGSAAGHADAFSRPSIGAISGDGSLVYVVDRDSRSPVIKVFDTSGRFVREIGSPGEGPGEYRSISAFGLRSDTIWISDAGTGRVTFYRPDGTVIESFGFGYDEAGVVTRVPVEVLGSDRFLVVSPPGPDLGRTGVGKVRFRQSVLLTDRQAAVLDTVVSYDVDYPVIVTRPGGGAIFRYNPAVVETPRVSYSSTSEVVREVHRPAPQSASVGQFRILIRRPRGDTLMQRTFLFRPVPVPRTVKDSVMAAASRSLRNAPVDLAAVALRYIELPDFQPAVSRGPISTENGDYWIEREAFPTNGREYLVLDRGLEPLATIQIPSRSGRLTGPITQTHVWFVELDDLDVPFLVRYRIVR